MSELTTTNTIEKFMEKATKQMMNIFSTPGIQDFVDVCKKDQATLKQELVSWAKNAYGDENVTVGDGFVLVVGATPVLLTAHMDTVHKELPNEVYEFEIENKHYITSPQGIGGDDRCGIYMIQQIVGDGYLPYILFCEDEEIGGIGSNKFIKTDSVKEIQNLKFYLELDRANSKDAVYYSCGNDDFQAFINEYGFETAHGSFSDISHLSPETDVASVNLSCGYYCQHTLNEYVVFEEMEETIEKVKLILEDADAISAETGTDVIEAYDYQQVRYGGWGSSTYRSSFYNDDYYDDFKYYGSKSKTKSGKRKSYAARNLPTYEYTGYFFYTDEDGYEEYEAVVEGDSKLSCIAKFLMENSEVRWQDVLDFYFDTDGSMEN